MIVSALLLLLAIICAYSWLTYKIKTTVPQVKATVPEPLSTNAGEHER